jgi:predicted aldo/keto reductase-like oxidoreductase
MYQTFLEECKKFINAAVETAVDDRRHDDVENGESVVHLATALSVPDLHAQVKERCPDGIPIPSIQWLRLQFWPRRKNSAAAKRYYGSLKIKYMIQARQFRHIMHQLFLDI